MGSLKNYNKTTRKNGRIILTHRNNPSDNYVFDNEKQLNDFMADYCEPLGGLQSSNFGCD